MNTTRRAETPIDRCDEILRAEISAVETDLIAIRHLPEAAAASAMRSIRDDHAASLEQRGAHLTRLEVLS